MTWLLDVNVAIAVHRRERAQHDVAREWLDSVRKSSEPFAVPSSVWASFLRIVTNPKIFEFPTQPGVALAFIDAVSEEPGFVALEPGPLHRRLFAEAIVEGGATGDLVADAYLVAIAREHAAQIVTFDRDFARFPSARHLLLTG